MGNSNGLKWFKMAHITPIDLKKDLPIAYVCIYIYIYIYIYIHIYIYIYI